jgi:hypothetical protein
VTFQAFFAVILLRVDNESQMGFIFIQHGGIAFVAICATILMFGNAIPFSRVMQIVQVLMAGEAGIAGGLVRLSGTLRGLNDPRGDE